MVLNDAIVERDARATCPRSNVAQVHDSRFGGRGTRALDVRRAFLERVRRSGKKVGRGGTGHGSDTKH